MITINKIVGLLLCCSVLSGCASVSNPAPSPTQQSTSTPSPIPFTSTAALQTPLLPTVEPSETVAPTTTQTPPATLTTAPSSTPAPKPAYPDAVTAVRLILARELSTTMSAIKVISTEKVEWPTACLGVQPRGAACADMITRGYRIILQANNTTYEYHTNATGDNYVLASPAFGRLPGAGTSDLALIWHREGGFAGFCDTVIVKKTGSYEVSPCGGRRTPITTTLQLDATQMTRLNDWISRLKPFGIGHVGPVNPDELIVEVSFYGLGVAEPSPDDKQAISDFAQQLRNTIK